MNGSKYKISLKTLLLPIILLIGALLFATGSANAQALNLPNISLNIGGNANEPEKVATIIQLLSSLRYSLWHQRYY